jgi:hypothetical protein
MRTMPARIPSPSSRRLRTSVSQTRRIELVPPAGITRLDIRPDWSQRLTAIGTLFAVIVGFGTLYFTNNANRDQTYLIAQGQITDRFTKAVEQLATDKTYLFRSSERANTQLKP